MRGRDIRFAVGALVCIPAGVAMLVFDRGQDRFGGVAALLFGLVLAMLALSGRLAWRSGVAPRVDRVEHDGALQPALVIPGQAIKLQLLRFAAALFAAAGVAIAVWSSPVLGGVVAVVFGGFAVLGVWSGRRPYRIVLLPEGLRWELGTRQPAYVPWDDITRVGTFNINNTWFLGLDAREDGGLRQPGPRGLAKLNRAISRSDASIALEAFPVEPDRLADVVAGYAADAGSRREIGTERSLAALGEAPRAEPTGSSESRRPSSWV
jgi:hypothetical protein